MICRSPESSLKRLRVFQEMGTASGAEMHVVSKLRKLKPSRSIPLKCLDFLSRHSLDENVARVNCVRHSEYHCPFSLPLGPWRFGEAQEGGTC